MYSTLLNIFRNKMNSCVLIAMRYLCSRTKTPTFGLLIDIDGVIVQGNVMIPKVLEAFKKLTSNGKLILPTVFVTNSGGSQLTKVKVDQLTDWLGFEFSEEHVVCSHTPFSVFKQFHDMNVLVTGQANVKEVARSAGFKRVVTVDELVKVFPMLDAIDISRRVSLPIPRDVEFAPIEAVALFGESVRWETRLQLLTDVLLTDGDPRRLRLDYPYPHLPVLACNMDLQWRFTPEIPRFGHGAFLVCLESVYKKITGRDLQYTVMVGKPSVITYKYALRLVEAQARRLGVEGKIETLYMIGDNINTDIFGGNLYNDHLNCGEKDVHYDPSIDVESSVKNCYSVLVKTGVSSEELMDQQMNHVHRDFLVYDKSLRTPTHTVEDFSDAIDLIFKLEDFG